MIELAPTRVNVIHPAIVGDSPQWVDMPPERHKALVDRTPIGRLVTMAESMSAARFLLENDGDQRHQPRRRRRLDVHVTLRTEA